MLRGLLVCAGLAAFVAPSLFAQNASVCVFQEKAGHAAGTTDSDADSLVRELDSHSLQAVAATGVSKGQEDAEAEKRSCSFIVTVWRSEVRADSPNYGGSLGSGELNPDGTMARMTNSLGGGLLQFNLRKAGSHKNLAHGESEDASPYGKMAADIAKKISKEK
jgi:hypothetical protein